MLGVEVIQHLNAKRFDRSVITGNNIPSALQDMRIPLKLRQPERRRHIGHIALVPQPHDIVFPVARTGFGKRVFGLSVQAEQLELMVKRLAVNRRREHPGNRAALGGCEILDRVETEAGEIRHRSDHFAVPFCPQRVRRVRADRHSADRPLQVVGRLEQVLFPLRDFKNAGIIAGNAAQIHGNDSLCALVDRSFQRVVVHLHVVLLRIDQHNFCAHMVDHRCRSGVGIGGHHNLVALSHAQYAKHQFRAGCLRIQTNAFFGSDPFRKFFFQFFGSRTGCDPTGAKRCANLLDFHLGNIGGAE